MNKLMIIGNLTRDPELRYTQNGKAVTSFDVAVNGRKRGDQQETTYFRVSAWDKLADLCKQYLAKGRKVMVMGPVSVRPWQSERDGSLHADLCVTANEVEFLSARGEDAQPTVPTAPRDPSGMTVVEEEPLPF